MKKLTGKMKITIVCLFIVGVIGLVYGIKSYQKAHQPFKDEFIVAYQSEFNYTSAINNIPEKDYDKISYEGEIDPDTLGSYPLEYTYDNETYEVTAIVKDITAPEFEVSEGTLRANEHFDPIQFVSNVVD